MGEPGWNEVALMLFGIHAEHTQNEGHFRLLARVNPSDFFQARFLMQALTGGELPFTDEERLQWLPIAIGCCLLHSNISAHLFFRKACYPIAIIDLMAKVLETGDPDKAWDVMVRALPDDELFYEHPIRTVMKRAWMALPQNDQCAAPLTLLLEAGIVDPTQGEQPFLYPELLPPVEAWVRAFWERIGDSLFWNRELERHDDWVMLDRVQAILPLSSPLWLDLWAQLPPYLGWCGELPTFGGWTDSTVPVIMLEKIYPKGRGSGEAFAYFLWQLHMILRSFTEFNFAPFSWSASADDRLKDIPTLRLAIQSGFFDVGIAWSNVRGLALRESYMNKNEAFIMENCALQGFVVQNPRVDHIEPSLKLAISTEALHRLRGQNKSHFRSLFSECLRVTIVHDWFQEQAKHPDLIRQRGLNPIEPVPQELAIFDTQGIPLLKQTRNAMEKLRNWLAKPKQVLAFIYPEGLPADPKRYLDDLIFLNKHSSGPLALLDRVLKNWPKDEPERNFDPELAKAKLKAELEDFARQAEEEPEKQKAS